MAVGNEDKMTPAEARKNLSGKQAEFVRRFLTHRNGTKAAIEAGYSEKTANEQAARLLANVSIRVILDAEHEKVERKFELSRQMIIDGLMNIAFNHVGNLATWNDEGEVTVRSKDDLTDNEMRFIESLECFKTEIERGEGEPIKTTKTSIRTLSNQRLKALELLGKHLGMWKEKDDGDGANKRNRATLLERVQGLVARRKDRAGEG